MVEKKVTRTVDRVEDGDTFYVNYSIEGVNYVRLGYIDTPEDYEPGYTKAKNTLKRLIEGKTVTITYSSKGRHNRIIAKRLTQNRKNIIDAMRGHIQNE